uniref:Mevalonate kinase n=1 Tax=Panagrellus redivivus TaxID=6233 RepID=A0A7E4VU22_PANRE
MPPNRLDAVPSAPDSPVALQSFYISAPGKIILFGEHAVLYQKTAIAGALDLRIYISLEEIQERKIYLDLPELGLVNEWSLKKLLADVQPHLDDMDAPALDETIQLARKLSGDDNDDIAAVDLAIHVLWYLLIGAASRTSNIPGMRIKVRCELPIRVGLGSSGAFCTGLTTAILCTSGLIPQPSVSVSDGRSTWSEKHLNIIREWASVAESIIHGRASGLDVAMSTYGGIAKYKLQKHIENLKCTQNLSVILVNSKIERSTFKMVKIVQEFCEKNTFAAGHMLDTIDSLSLEAAAKLTQGASGDAKSISPDSINFLDSLCQINDACLNSFGVGHSKLDAIRSVLARRGLHGKLTGAGGGGCVFAFLKPDLSTEDITLLKSELNAIDCEVWLPSLGGPGVVLHDTAPGVFLN